MTRPTFALAERRASRRLGRAERRALRVSAAGPGPRDPWPRTPASRTCSATALRDYGNRVGLWRMFDVMDQLRHPLHDPRSISRCSITIRQILEAHAKRGNGT